MDGWVGYLGLTIQKSTYETLLSSKLKNNLSDSTNMAAFVKNLLALRSPTKIQILLERIL